MRRFVSMFLVFVLASIFMAMSSPASRPLSKAFELKRYVEDEKANGETDFQGETEYMEKEERVDFLGDYADYASKFFGDPQLDTKVVSDAEVRELLDNLKPQPRPDVRRSIVPDEWKWVAAAPGQRAIETAALKQWDSMEGVAVQGGALVVEAPRAQVGKTFDPIEWRAMAEFELTPAADGGAALVEFTSAGEAAISVGCSEGSVVYRTGGKAVKAGVIEAGKPHVFRLDIDLATHRYNLFVDDELLADYVEMQSGDVGAIDGMALSATSGARFDNIYLLDFVKGGPSTKPYSRKSLLDEDFEIVPDISGWQNAGYDDSGWGLAALPKVVGGERNAGKDLYLRREVEIGEYERAQIKIDEISPGGEIWINGRVVEVVKDRYPIRIDVTDYLQPGAKNLIAVKVNAFQPPSKEFIHKHTPAVPYVGWYMGRMSLELTPYAYIDDVFAYTSSVEGTPTNRTVITLGNKYSMGEFRGSVAVKYYKWFPEESTKAAAEAEYDVVLFPTLKREVDEPIALEGADLWSPEDPNLYKVVVQLKDREGNIVDDMVVTTGIRTVSQTGGTFRINGQPALFKGVQTMGFRAPIEIIDTYARYATDEMIAEELLMTSKMDGNGIRFHNHAFVNRPDGVNDPRIPEMADQHGLMLIWLTGGWIRSQHPWVVDFDGYPKYMKLVRNRPSIVMWEAANHPDQFKRYSFQDACDYVTKVYNTIHPNDPSRLISFSSHFAWTPFRNPDGKLRRGGRVVREACPEYTAPMVTSGNQDAITGYTHNWTVLRKWPSEWRQAFLDSDIRAWFNFEHEESIGQPNWSLGKGKPWYRIYSYERKYDGSTIGRWLVFDEWRESQAWQGMSAYESMRKQRMLDYDGFSWCCLHGGANMGTYMKPLIDNYGHAKLAWYANKMVFQDVLAGSDDVDMVYGPGDEIRPIVLNLGPARTVAVLVAIKTLDGRVLDSKTYKGVQLPAGRNVTRLEAFKPKFGADGNYAIEYTVLEQ